MVLVHLPASSSSSKPLPSTAKDYSHAYYHILKCARRHSAVSSAAAGAVLILVATDVDALCAARALARLLSEDEIMYRIAPVDGFRTLQRIVQEDVVGNEDLHSLVLLNLGSLLSLPSYFGPEALPLPSSANVHLIDSHRPWNLDNLFATNEIMDRLWVWDDGDIITRMQREREAYEALEFEVDSDDEDEEDEDDDEDGSQGSFESGSGVSDEEEVDGDSPSGSKRRRVRTTSASGSQLADEDDEDDEGGGRSRASSSSRSPPPQRRRRRRRHRKRISRSPSTKVSREQKDVYRAILARYYNRGTGLGMSVAGMLFVLAEALGRAENEGLWLAILGLTSQYLTSSIPSDLYDEYATGLASDVVALNPPMAGNAGQSARQSHLPKPVSADDGRIRVINDELRFTLYRHWSLESAMCHTPYVAGKLGIWREKGLSKIRGLLAKMGFSLIHSRQHYKNMPLDLRNSLTQRLEAIAPEYGLTDLVLKSFVRSFGYRSNPLSAMDTVEGLNALLIAATGLRVEVQDEALTFSGAAPNNTERGSYRGTGTPMTSELFGAKRMWSIGGGGGGGGSGTDGKENQAPANGVAEGGAEGTEDAALAAPRQQSETWSRNFFVAYGALESKRSASLMMLNSSLSLARSLHSAILDVGTSLIDKQSIRSLKSFRLAILRDGPHLDIFSTQPAMLTRLGLWLTDALRDIVTEQERRKHELKKQRKADKRAASRRKTASGDGSKGTENDDDDDVAALQSLPFVLCALNATRDLYLVVGLIGSPDFGDVQRNRFGLAFQDAIRKSGARARSEGWFDTTAVEIRKEDLTPFVERLELRS